MDIHLMASIYDIKGDKEKVMKIYRQILQDNPSDKKAEDSLRRLATKSMSIQGLNRDMFNFFIKARSKEELIELERWLVGN